MKKIIGQFEVFSKILISFYQNFFFQLINDLFYLDMMDFSLNNQQIVFTKKVSKANLPY